MVLNNHILYAPWRKKYITSNLRKSQECIFCNLKKEDVILSSKRCFLQANKYPYSEGHLLAISKRHVTQIIDLTSKEREEIFNLIDLGIYALNLYMKPQGYNIGCSIGSVAGESINHLHFHILPRFRGDVSWTRFCDLSIISISPQDINKDLKEIILKNKLKKKFNL